MSNYLSITYIKEKWGHAGFQKYFRNTGWMFGGRMFSLVISFFVGAYIARYLGPSNYGLLSYVISFVGLFGFLASFGIDGIVSREIIKDHALKDKIIGTSFFLKLIGAMFTITTIAITAFFTTSETFTLLLIFLFSLSYIPQAFNIIEVYFQSQVLSKNVVRAQISATLIATVLKILVIVFDKGIFWLTLIYIVEASLFALFLLISFKYYGHHFRSWRFDVQVAKSLLKDSWPLMLSSLAIGIYMKIDQVMIKHMLGDEQVGIYSVAVRLSEVWYFIPMIICTSVFPSIVQAVNTNQELVKTRMKKLYSLMFWMSFGIAIFMTLSSSLIIKLLFGQAYLGAIVVLKIYVWAGVIIFFNVAIGQYMVIMNFTKLFLYSTIIGAVLNILLNILLIQKLGISGAALSTLISYFFATASISLFKETKEQFFLMFDSIFNLKALIK